MSGLNQKVGWKEVVMVVVILAVLIPVLASKKDFAFDSLYSLVPGFLDKAPKSKSVYEITKMSESERKQYFKDLEEKRCKWVAREYKRKPGLLLSAELEQCREDGIIK